MRNDKKDMDFGKKAAGYDGFWGRLSRRFYRLLLSEVELWPGAAVLDVACGTGAVLRKMADACSIRGFGIDMSENMIEEAKRKCPDMDIQISRCEKTPFGDGSFDIITTCMAYHHFSDKAGFAKEAARILKPGGCLYIADPRLPGVIRKIINSVFSGLHIAGGFFSPEQIYSNFSVYGFEPARHAKDGYAQVVCVKMPGVR